MNQTRREFLAAGGAVAAAGLTAPFSLLNAEDSAKPKKLCALKYSMIRIDGTMLEKFKAVKEIGFEGVEIKSPNDYKLDEVLEAQEKSGLKIHGVLDAVHWNDTLSSPDPQVRQRGLDALLVALDDAKRYGASTVLLVPGRVNDDVTYEQCWERSIAYIRKAIPRAEERGVKIAIENVWNDFITDPKEFVRYLDEIDSPYVGAYFDIGNTVRYSPPEQWIPLLGDRIVKLDVKEYRHKGGFTHELGDGDVDWPAVMRELRKIGYSGWYTAEMRGGDAEHLTDMLRRMHRALEIKS